jgi:hypothetical protein
LVWEEGGLHFQHISGGKAGILKGSENTEYRWSLAVSGKERPCIERKKKPKVRCTLHEEVPQVPKPAQLGHKVRACIRPNARRIAAMSLVDFAASVRYRCRLGGFCSGTAMSRTRQRYLTSGTTPPNLERDASRVNDKHNRQSALSRTFLHSSGPV